MLNNAVAEVCGEDLAQPRSGHYKADAGGGSVCMGINLSHKLPKVALKIQPVKVAVVARLFGLAAVVVSGEPSYFGFFI